MMTCRQFEDLLNERLDGREVGDPAALAEHVRTCTDCRGLEAASRRLQQGLHRPPPQPSPDLAARIVARVAADRRRRGRRVRYRWRVTVALAACLVLALGLRTDWFGLRGLVRGPAPANQVTRQQEPSDKRQEPAEAETLRDSVAEASRAVAALTRETTTETVNQTRSLLPEVAPPALPPVDLAQLEPTTRPWREAGEGVTMALEPVANSARRAVNLFLRELPPVDMTREY
jgi:hypothetical protein